ncbi:MAG: hypothetical protein ACRDDX_12840 [Cellulosilyticaceae bacterium]
MALLGVILKLILYSLLGIIGVLLGLVCVVLFLPIDYQVYYEAYRQSTAQVKVRFFYVCRVNYENAGEGGLLKVYVFGIPIKTMDLSAEDIKDASEEVAEDLTKTEETFAKDTTPPAPVLEKQSSKASTQVKGQATKPIKKQKKKSASPMGWKEQVEVLWKSPYRKGFFAASYKALKDILKMLKPGAIYFKLLIGKEDPAETGQLIAKITMAYPLFHSFGSVEGCYTEAGIWGEIGGRGRIRLGRFLKILIVFAVNKDVRNYIKIILNVRKVDQNGNKA